MLGGDIYQQRNISSLCIAIQSVTIQNLRVAFIKVTAQGTSEGMESKIERNCSTA